MTGALKIEEGVNPGGKGGRSETQNRRTEAETNSHHAIRLSGMCHIYKSGGGVETLLSLLSPAAMKERYGR